VDRTPPFFAIVNLLLDNLRSDERVKEWWDIGRAQLVDLLSDRASVLVSSSWLPDYLTLGNGEFNNNVADATVTANPFLEKLIEIWATDYHLGFMAGSQDHSEKILRDTMLQFGKKYLKVRTR
jgi:hypothetical protein